MDHLQRTVPKRIGIGHRRDPRRGDLVLKKANAGIDTWTDLGSSLRKTGQKLDGIASRSEALIAGIENGDGTLGQLFGDASLADETLELLRNSQALIGQASSALTNINATVALLHEGSARFPEITDALAAEAKDLPGLVKQAQTSMREMEAVILAMQKHWILRRYVSKTNENRLMRESPGRVSPYRR